MFYVNYKIKLMTNFPVLPLLLRILKALSLKYIAMQGDSAAKGIILPNDGVTMGSVYYQLAYNV